MNPSNPLGTDNRFHNVGVSARHQDFEALAHKALDAPGQERHRRERSTSWRSAPTCPSSAGSWSRGIAPTSARFRTPQIRNIGITAPYMHDGSMQTLWDVMDHYNKGGEANPFLDGGIEPLALTEQEIDQLVAFLFTLTDDRFADENAAALERQRAAARQKRPFRDDALAQRRKVCRSSARDGPQTKRRAMSRKATTRASKPSYLEERERAAPRRCGTSIAARS